MAAALLSTVGVAVTTLLIGLAAYALFDLSWLEAVLLGAVVASTDAAAVFATLRFTNIRRRLARTLEAESGGNDPMGATAPSSPLATPCGVPLLLGAADVVYGQVRASLQRVRSRERWWIRFLPALRGAVCFWS